MQRLSCTLFLFLVICTQSFGAPPALEQDTEVVESVIREVRAAKPKYNSHKDDDHDEEEHYSSNGDVGYNKETKDKGVRGYSQYDSFHKKDGDKYGFEEHSAYGLKEKGEKDDSHKQKGSYSEAQKDDDEGAEEQKGDDHHGQHTYKVFEEINEDGDEDDHQSENLEGDEDHEETSEDSEDESESEGYASDDDEDPSSHSDITYSSYSDDGYNDYE